MKKFLTFLLSLVLCFLYSCSKNEPPSPGISCHLIKLDLYDVTYDYYYHEDYKIDKVIKNLRGDTTIFEYIYSNNQITKKIIKSKTLNTSDTTYYEYNNNGLCIKTWTNTLNDYYLISYNDQNQIDTITRYINSTFKQKHVEIYKYNDSGNICFIETFYYDEFGQMLSWLSSIIEYGDKKNPYTTGEPIDPAFGPYNGEYLSKNNIIKLTMASPATSPLIITYTYLSFNEFDYPTECSYRTNHGQVFDNKRFYFDCK
jgi:hypothetical protein